MTPESTPVDETPGQTPPEEVEGAALSEAEEQKLLDKAIAAAKAVAKEVVETLTGTKPEGEGEETPPEGEEERPAEPATPAAIENHMEEQVRLALEKIGADKAHEEEHQRMREAEKPPVQHRRSTRFLWGGGDDAA